MNHFEDMNENRENKKSENESLSKRVNELLKDCSSAEFEKKDKNLLDARLGEMNREDLLNLTMEIQQYLNEARSGFADKNSYVRFATVYGGACLQLEKLDIDNK